MSKENVEIVRRALRHISDTGEPDLELYDPDVVWTTRSDGPGSSTYRGLAGIRRGHESFREAWAEHRGEIIDVVEVGDAQVTQIRWQLRAHSGVELEVVEGWAVWVRDGKITRLEQRGSRQEAFEAAGLSE